MNTQQNLKISNLSNFKKYSSLYLKLNKKDWKNSTYQKNKGIVKNRLSYFNEFDIRLIKVIDIRIWLNSINDVSSKSKIHYLSCLNGIFTIAFQDEIIFKNPVKFIKNPKYRKPKINPFTKYEVQKILEASKRVNDNFHLFLQIGFNTGMRTGEIIALKYENINLKDKVIFINSTKSRFGENTPKTYGSIRTIPIIDNLFPFLESKFATKTKNDIYLLETQYYKAYRDSNTFTYKFWKKTLNNLKIPYRRLYTMRHTFATNMLKNNFVTPFELASILGHTSTEMVYNVYVRYLNENYKDFKRDIKLY